MARFFLENEKYFFIDFLDHSWTFSAGVLCVHGFANVALAQELAHSLTNGHGTLPYPQNRAVMPSLIFAYRWYYVNSPSNHVVILRTAQYSSVLSTARHQFAQ